jgi:putrescine---pyruvate transaminase
VVVFGDVGVEPAGPVPRSAPAELAHRRQVGQGLVDRAQRDPGHLGAGHREQGIGAWGGPVAVQQPEQQLALGRDLQALGPEAFLHPFAKPTREQFITIARGDGALLWDSDGNELIDAMASLWYCQVGHGRREIADAVAEQMSTIESYSCFDPFTNAPADALAARIAELTPIPDARVFFAGSGSEAVDTAMKLARLAHVQAGNPERRLIISRVRGYHGTNYGGTSAQGIAPNRAGYGELLVDVVQVPSDDAEALSVLMAEHTDRVAAVIAEPIQGAGGVFPPTDGYLADRPAVCATNTAPC